MNIQAISAGYISHFGTDGVPGDIRIRRFDHLLSDASATRREGLQGLQGRLEGANIYQKLSMMCISLNTWYDIRIYIYRYTYTDIYRISIFIYLYLYIYTYIYIYTHTHNNVDIYISQNMCIEG